MVFLSILIDNNEWKWIEKWIKQFKTRRKPLSGSWCHIFFMNPNNFQLIQIARWKKYYWTRSALIDKSLLRLLNYFSNFCAQRFFLVMSTSVHPTEFRSVFGSRVQMIEYTEQSRQVQCDTYCARERFRSNVRGISEGNKKERERQREKERQRKREREDFIMARHDISGAALDCRR